MASVPKGVRLTCIMDCSHSGNIHIRYQYTSNLVMSEYNNYKPVVGDIVLLSACTHEQTASDSCFTGKWVKTPRLHFVWGEGNGAFTWYLLKALKTCGFTVSIADLIKGTQSLLIKNKFTQTPKITCSKPELVNSRFLTKS